MNDFINIYMIRRVLYMMINDMQMAIGALIGGVLGGLLIMGAMAVTVFTFDLVEKIIEKEEEK